MTDLGGGGDQAAANDSFLTIYGTDEYRHHWL